MRVLRTAAVGAAVIIAATVLAWSQILGAAGAASDWVDIKVGEATVARVRLVANAAIAANAPALAGVEIVLADGWKTYWRTPGDAGVPPTFDWVGSANVGAIKERYPAPVRMSEAGGEVIAYKGTVLFPIEVMPKERGKPVSLKLALEFGVCRDICVPANAKLSVDILPGRAGAIPREIATALDRVPRPQQGRRKGDPELKRVTVDRDGPTPRLMIEAVFAGAGNGADVFVEAPEGIYIPLPKRLSRDAGGIVRYAADLAPDSVRDLRGKTLTLTLVSEAGASEAQWTFP